MQADSRSRKWQITINNPVEKGYTHEKIVEILKEFKSIVYYCMSDEIGEAGTYHTHIFIAAGSGIRFSTLLNRFEKCHFEMANGNCQQNRDYVFKESKWKNDKKADTNRYQNRTACYEKVFIISNVGLDKLYQTERRELPLQYDALLRRIGYIMEYDKKGEMQVKPRKEVYPTSYELEGEFVRVPDYLQENLPFCT